MTIIEQYAALTLAIVHLRATENEADRKGDHRLAILCHREVLFLEGRRKELFFSTDQAPSTKDQTP